MKRAIEAVVHDDVLVIADQSGPTASDVTRLSERALAEDWERPEEEAAWSHLQPVGSS